MSLNEKIIHADWKQGTHKMAQNGISCCSPVHSCMRHLLRAISAPGPEVTETNHVQFCFSGAQSLRGETDIKTNQDKTMWQV